MAKRRLHLTYPEGLIKEPVIYNIGTKFAVVTNIRRANVEESVGWVVLELDGPDEEIEKATRYLDEVGVRVDSIDGDIVGG